MVKPKLYYIEISPASRAVLLTARALQVDLELIPCDTLAGEHLTAEFLAINPQHCVPTLVDGTITVWDSHAICQYLVDRYAHHQADKDQLLTALPTTNDVDALATRALFEQRLHFHHGTLFTRYYAVIWPVVRFGAVHFDVSDDQLVAIHEALGFLERFLADSGAYVCGEALSVVDILCVTTVSSMERALGVDVSARHPRIAAWWQRLTAELPGFAEIETVGVATIRPILLAKVEENQKKKLSE